MIFADNDIRKLIDLGVLNKPEQSNDFKQTYGSVVSINPIRVIVDGSTEALSYGIKNFSGINITVGSRVVLAKMGSEFIITGVNHLVSALMLKDDAITSSTNIGALESGIYKVNSSNNDFPTSSNYFGTLLSFAETAYKVQILFAGVSGKSELYFRRYLSDSVGWSSWIKVQDEKDNWKVPVGTVVPFAGVDLPSGWLWCRGGAVSRTTYAKLYKVLGTKYGKGDGNTTFNVPNLQGKFPLGYSSSHAVSTSGGEETHKLTVSEMPSHNHSINNPHTDDGSNVVIVPETRGTAKRDADHYSWQPTGYRGGDGAHNNMPPYLTLNYIIYAGV